MEDRLYSIFDRSEESHWWFLARRKIILSLVQRICGDAAAAFILDIGSGAGGTLRELERYGITVGVDISPRAVAYCRRRGCRRLVRVGERGLPFRAASFDLIIALDVIEHITDDRAALREYWRLLKPGGWLVLTAPAYHWLWSWHDEVNQHRRRYTRRSLRLTLAAAGVVPERISYFCFFLFLPVVLIRILEKILRRLYGHRREELAFRVPPRPLNNLLTNLFAAERYWLRRRGFLFGSSLLVLARKE